MVGLRRLDRCRSRGLVVSKRLTVRLLNVFVDIQPFQILYLLNSTTKVSNMCARKNTVQEYTNQQ